MEFFRGRREMKSCNDKTLLERVFDKNKFFWRHFIFLAWSLFFFAKSKKCSRQNHSSSLREDITCKEK